MKAQLSAVISPRYNDKRKQVGSHIYIVIKGPTHNIGVAQLTAGGKWTEAQALREFNIARQRFAPLEDGMKLAQAMKLCE